MDYTRKTIRKERYSAELAKHIAMSQRSLSIYRYYICKVFRNRHETNYNTNPVEATVQQLAKYLVQMKNNNK